MFAFNVVPLGVKTAVHVLRSPLGLSKPVISPFATDKSLTSKPTTGSENTIVKIADSPLVKLRSEILNWETEGAKVSTV